MSDLFDDHPNVVVLEQVVRKLVLQQCRLSADPDAVLADWRAFLQQHHDLYVRSGFSEEVTAARMNTIFVVVDNKTAARIEHEPIVLHQDGK